MVPVAGGGRWLDEVVGAILAEDDGRPFEVVLVDDETFPGESGRLARLAAADPRVRVVAGPRKGAAAAVNAGVRAARQPLIAQVDQDVVLEKGWLARLAAALEGDRVAAAQGRYVTARASSWWARAAGYDLELRYARLPGREVDHVCTGNSVYRAAAIEEVGLFDEDLGYGYDNRMSYRLVKAGHRLVFEREARSRHAWRENLGGYLRQQFGQGYGRLDLVWRHPERVGGDAVSGALMILHAPTMLAAVVSLAVLVGSAAAGRPWPPAGLLAGGLVALLAAERLQAAVAAWRLVGDPVALFMVPAHLLRDLAWAWAIVTWTWHRLLRRPADPRASMQARS